MYLFTGTVERRYPDQSQAEKIRIHQRVLASVYRERRDCNGFLWTRLTPAEKITI